jgi:hypothetical protein
MQTISTGLRGCDPEHIPVSSGVVVFWHQLGGQILKREAEGSFRADYCAKG